MSERRGAAIKAEKAKIPTLCPFWLPFLLQEAARGKQELVWKNSPLGEAFNFESPSEFVINTTQWTE